MRVFLSSLLLLFALNNANSQEFKADFGYKYIFVPQLDKAIQTYNFSRPFMTKRQPLFINGLNASTSYIFKSTGPISHGMHLSYSYFRSSTKNEELNNTLNLHFVNLGYLLHVENSEKLKGFYGDFIVSATSSGLFRKINDEYFTYDEKTSKAFSIGGDLNLKAGYYLNVNGKIHLSPFILAGYSPYIYSPNNEAVINQTKGLASKNWSNVFSAQIGLAFHVKQE